MMADNGLAGKVNLLCLLAAIVGILFLPLKKEIWYDETVSMLCAKGISHDTPTDMANISATSATELAKLNTPGDVFNATVVDNGNSFLYNISLHWFTGVFGDSLYTYTLFSRLCGVALLIAFFLLCGLVMEGSMFTSLAVLSLAIDLILGVGHEIRAYAMGAFMITAASVFFYRFTYRKSDPLLLLATGLFSVGAVLCHFLSVYVVLVFLAVMVYERKRSLFTVKNIIAMLIPVALAGLFFYHAMKGLQVMSGQNQKIAEAARSFSAMEVVKLAMKYTAVNFKFIFPLISGNMAVILLSFLAVPILYFSALYVAGEQRRKNLHLLFLLGVSGSVFLAALCFKSRHYTALYYRYFSFCVPFCCLFTAYAFHVLATRYRAIIPVATTVVIIPVAFFFFGLFLRRAAPVVKYNHPAIAREIVSHHIEKIEVPEWSDALLIQTMLPDGFKIDYVRNPSSTNFTLFKNGSVETIPVIKNNT